MTSAPFFSVIIPTVNRAALVRRAIDSILAQEFRDFEIVVVDSASTDATRQVVRESTARDPRVHLVCEETRRGVCPARNIGVDHARGEWVIFLDSDDELAGPQTMTAIRARIAESGGEADYFRFMCRWDDGSTSPVPPLRDEIWDYAGYLRFLDGSADGGRVETLYCARRSTFGVVRYPEDRSYETLYNLELAQRFRTRACSDVARRYHTDADDQNSFAPNPQHWLRVAPDVARSLNTVVERHGAAMRKHAPRAYAELLRSAAKFNFLAGDRRRGVRLLLRFWRRQPALPLSWGIFALGILGPRAMAWADARRFAMHRRRIAADAPVENIS